MFYIAVAIFVAVFIYVVFILPETFPEEKRKELSRRRSVDEIPTTARLAALLFIFEPLKMLVPSRTSGGTRNWRLTWCAAHTFMFVTAHTYALSAWLVLVTSKYHLTPADVGNWYESVPVQADLIYSRLVFSSPLLLPPA